MSTTTPKGFRVTPYYEDEAVTIYHGDGREWVGQCSFAAIITDPPYGTNYYPTDTDAFTAGLLRDWTAYPLAVFGWPEKLIRLCVEARVHPDEWVTWWPTNAACRSFAPKGLMREAECVAVFGEFDWKRLKRPHSSATARIQASGFETGHGPISEGGANLGDVWTDASPGLGFNHRDRLHPNQKPLRVLHRLVEAMVAPGQRVLDPFMGSGTTLRAAKDLGRTAIGFDLVEQHCETAAKRMAQEVLPL